MSSTGSTDLHPEDLIDKLARGELTKAEHERLRAHFAVCHVCRIEHAARRDFEAAFSSAKKLYDPSPRAFGALEGLLSGAAGDGRRRRSSSLPPSSRMRHLAAGIAAALLISSAAAGARMWPRLRPFFVRTNVEQLSLVQGPGGHALGSTKQGPRAKSRIDEIESEREAPLPGPTAPPAAISRPPEHPDTSHEAPSIDPKPGVTAVSLFSSANTARRRGESPEAVQLYRELQRRFPKSSEAHISRATLARLLLDRGSPGAALKEFQEYLSGGGGELEEEALVGEALSLQSLGRREAEMAVWNDFLRNHRGSVYCEQARARLSALSRP
jgi:hypothetical protein